MRITKSKHGVVLIEIREGEVARTKERPGDILVDLDSNGEVLCIEVVGGDHTSAPQLLAVFKEFGLDEKLILATGGAG
jgi:uncharacterized protein YuzE